MHLSSSSGVQVLVFFCVCILMVFLMSQCFSLDFTFSDHVFYLVFLFFPAFLLLLLLLTIVFCLSPCLLGFWYYLCKNFTFFTIIYANWSIILTEVTPRLDSLFHSLFLCIPWIIHKALLRSIGNMCSCDVDLSGRLLLPPVTPARKTYPG